MLSHSIQKHTLNLQLNILRIMLRRSLPKDLYYQLYLQKLSLQLQHAKFLVALWDLH